MNSAPNSMPDSPVESQGIAPARISASRCMYWSIRRELWEYRSIYVAPLAAAAILLFGFLVGLPHHMRAVTTLYRAHEGLANPYELAAGLILGTGFFRRLIYSLSYMNGKPRD